jgi:hypothetical protein
MCLLSELIAMLEKQFSLDLTSQTLQDPDSLKVQNEELFPFIKVHACVLPNPKNQVCLTMEHALEFVGILRRVRPDLDAAIAS